jgi:hypothetical protein
MKTNAFLSTVFTLQTTSAEWTNPAEKNTTNPPKSEYTYALLWLLCQTGSAECTTFLKAQSCQDFSRKTCLNLILT